MTNDPIGLVQLARIANVSAATVSRALANNPRVASATRERIQELAREHGFRLNQTASAFRKQRTGTIRVIVPLGHEIGIRLTDPFFVGLIGPLADALTSSGYDLLLTRVVPDHATWLEDLIDRGRADGVIVIGQSGEIAAIERVAQRYRAMVVWGAHLPGAHEISVGTDNEAGGGLAATHLIAKQRRRLLFAGNPAIPEFAARYAGFQSVVHRSQGVDEVFLRVHATGEEPHAEILTYLRTHPTPDGIFAASDMIAVSAMRAVAEYGLRVPHDIAIVGYDDVSIARHTNPPLTSVRQDMERGAKLLVDLLVARINGQDVRSIMMTPELVVRESA